MKEVHLAADSVYSELEKKKQEESRHNEIKAWTKNWKTEMDKNKKLLKKNK